MPVCDFMRKVQRYFLLFMMYAFIGWAYEVFLEVVVYNWGFSNRGVLFGPYLPVYGFGALAFLLCFSKILKNKTLKQKLCYIPLIFLGCMIVATVIELVTSYICEFFTGSWPWQTYADYKYNFEARIALSPSIRFGIGGIIFLYVFQPLFDKMLNKLSNKTRNIIFYLLLVILIIDIICSFFIF